MGFVIFEALWAMKKASFKSASASGDDLVFVKNDNSTLTVADALKPMTDIVSDVGIELAKLQGIAFAINADGELEVEI